MAGRGGFRPGAGRKAGVPTKTSLKLGEEARSHALPYAKGAIREAARIAGLIKGKQGAKNPAVRVSAINSILDRAYGKAKQPMEGEMLHGVSEELRKFIAGNTEPSRNFIGFDEEATEPEDAADVGPLQHH